MEDESTDHGPPVELSEDETAVMLSHTAGASLSELSASTGVPVDRMEAIVSRLTNLGLIEAALIPIEDEDDAAEPRAAEPRAAGAAKAPALALDLDLEDDAPAGAGEETPTADEGLVALLDGALDGLDLSMEEPSGADADGEAAKEAGEEGAAGDKGDKEEARPKAAARAPEAKPAAGRAPDAAAEGEDEVELSVEEPKTEGATETREYEKLYATELHPLPTDERVALAGTVSDARLFALCYDPEPPVIRAIFENSAANVEHARMVAFHHRTGRGLEELVRRSGIASDPLVHRRLIRNPALDESQFRRVMGGKRLLEVYKVSLDKDVPERSRAAARTLFRNKWTSAQPEERVEIVWATEGRVLLLMTGLTFDSRTTAILCSKTYASIMLIQALARFSATPPTLIAHLLRQPLVKRQVHLKNQLLAHQNTPADAKRRV